MASSLLRSARACAVVHACFGARKPTVHLITHDSAFTIMDGLCLGQAAGRFQGAPQTPREAFSISTHSNSERSSVGWQSQNRCYLLNATYCVLHGHAQRSAVSYELCACFKPQSPTFRPPRQQCHEQPDFDLHKVIACHFLLAARRKAASVSIVQRMQDAEQEIMEEDRRMEAEAIARAEAKARAAYHAQQAEAAAAAQANALAQAAAMAPAPAAAPAAPAQQHGPPAAAPPQQQQQPPQQASAPMKQEPEQPAIAPPAEQAPAQEAAPAIPSAEDAPDPNAPVAPPAVPPAGEPAVAPPPADAIPGAPDGINGVGVDPKFEELPVPDAAVGAAAPPPAPDYLEPGVPQGCILGVIT